MPPTNDSSLEVLLDDSQIIPLAIWATAVTILGIAGNVTVIFSSIRYNAIKMDKVSLLLVQNLAVADLLYILQNVFPAAANYSARRYVLGKAYCFFSAQMAFISAQVNTITVLTITAYRLRLVCSPLSSISLKVAKIGIAVIWVTASTTTIICLAYKSESVFSQKSAKCFSTIYVNKAASVLFRIVFGGIVIIPLIAIVIINAILFTISIRSNRRFKESSHIHTSTARTNARALTTVCALSSAFVISWTPYLIYLVWKGIDPDMPFVVEQFSQCCLMINSFCNPILYTMTNKRFGTFVWNMMRNSLPKKRAGNSSDNPTQSSSAVNNSGKIIESAA